MVCWKTFLPRKTCSFAIWKSNTAAFTTSRVMICKQITLFPLLSLRLWINMKFRFALFLASLAPLTVHAEVRLPAVFADHMVIQRDMPMHVWGYASPTEAVTVTFRGETQRAV